MITEEIWKDIPILVRVVLIKNTEKQLMDTNGHTSLCEDYVSFETSKLLKEKGFKHWCYKSYGDAVCHKGVPISFDEECELKSAGLENEIEYVEGGCLYGFGCDNRKKDAKIWAAPTLQTAMKWLREVHKVNIEIHYNRFEENYRYIIIHKPEVLDDIRSLGVYYHYEEACEEAIIYCLKYLIHLEYEK